MVPSGKVPLTTIDRSYGPLNSKLRHLPPSSPATLLPPLVGGWDMSVATLLLESSSSVNNSEYIGGIYTPISTSRTVVDNRAVPPQVKSKAQKALAAQAGSKAG